jgi:2'-5' RNA ligase
MTERLFLCVALDDEVRHALATRLAEVLDGGFMPGRPVAVENWHITLRFLGAATEVQRDSVLAHLDQHLQVEPFRIRFDTLGAFPRASRAAILWAGIAAGAEELIELAGECEAAADASEFGREDRPFHPHLTLARIRPPEDVRDLVEGQPLGVRMQVGEVTMLRSIMGRGPVRYEVVDTVAL